MENSNTKRIKLPLSQNLSINICPISAPHSSFPLPEPHPKSSALKLAEAAISENTENSRLTTSETDILRKMQEHHKTRSARPQIHLKQEILPALVENASLPAPLLEGEPLQGTFTLMSSVAPSAKNGLGVKKQKKRLEGEQSGPKSTLVAKPKKSAKPVPQTPEKNCVSSAIHKSTTESPASNNRITKKFRVDPMQLNVQDPIEEFKEIVGLGKQLNGSSFAGLVVVLHTVLRQKTEQANDIFSWVPEEAINELFQTVIGIMKEAASATCVDSMSSAAQGCVSLLLLLTIPCVNQKFNQEEYVEEICNFCQFFLTTLFNQLQTPVATSSTSKQAKTKKAHQSKHKDLTATQDLIRHACELTDAFAQFLEMTVVSSTALVTLATLALQAFQVESARLLQFSCMGMLKAVFVYQPDLQAMVMEDAFALLAKLPIKGKSLRTYQLTNSKHMIQMSSALIMGLLQSTCTPNSKSNESVSELYENAAKASRSFLNNLLQRCSNKEFESEYKPILENFVHDVISAFNTPEWPVAELLLRLVSTYMLSYLSMKDVSGPLKNTFMELIGLILCKLREEQNLVRPKNVNNNNNNNDNNNGSSSSNKLNQRENQSGQKGNTIESGDEEPQLDCLCGLVRENSLCIDCNACKKWYHCDCVSISPNNVPSVWHCDSCQIAAQIDIFNQHTAHGATETELFEFEENTDQDDESETEAPSKNTKAATTKKKKTTTKKKKESTSKKKKATTSSTKNNKKPAAARPKVADVQDFVMKVLLLEELGQLALHDRQYHEAQLFFLSCWCATEQTNPDHFSTPVRLSSTLTADGLTRIVRTIHSKNSLMTSFDRLLHFVLDAINSASTVAGLRKKAIQALSQVIATDSRVLMEPGILNTIAHNFASPLASIRESALDLIGKYVVEHPSLVSTYLPLLLARVSDAGVSVRKRVIKVLHAIVAMDRAAPQSAEICVRLLSCPQEEPAVATLVHAVWRDLLFEEDNTINQDNKANNKLNSKFDNDNNNNNNNNNNSGNSSSRTTQLATILVNVIAARSYPLAKDLVKGMLVRLVLPAKESEAVSPKMQKQIDQVCRHLISLFVNLDEQRASLKDPEETRKISQKLLCFGTVLRLLSTLSPRSVVACLTCFPPYLKVTTPSGIDTLILVEILGVLEACFTQSFWLEQQELFSKIEEDLFKLILTQPTTLTKAAVHTLIALTQLKQDPTFLEKLLVRYYGQIVQFHKSIAASKTSLREDNMRTLARALCVSGLLIRDFDFPESARDTSFQRDPKELAFLKASPELLFKEYQYFYQTSSHTNFTKAIKEMSLFGIGVLIQIPSVMTNAVPIVQDCLNSPVLGWQTKVDNLKSLEDFFVKTALSDDENGVRTNLAQSFLPHIQKLLVDPDHSQLRKAAISLAETIFRQGMGTPLDLLPELIGLAISDTDTFVQSFSLLKFLEFKKSCVHKRILKGLEMSWQVWKSLVEKHGKAAPAPQFAHFAELFALVPKKKRLETLQNFLQLPQIDTVGFVQHLAKCICLLDFEEDEKKLFLKHLETKIAVEYSIKEKEKTFGPVHVLLLLKKNLKNNEKDLRTFDLQQFEKAKAYTTKKQNQNFEKLFEENFKHQAEDDNDEQQNVSGGVDKDNNNNNNKNTKKTSSKGGASSSRTTASKKTGAPKKTRGRPPTSSRHSEDDDNNDEEDTQDWSESDLDDCSDSPKKKKATSSRTTRATSKRGAKR